MKKDPGFLSIAIKWIALILLSVPGTDLRSQPTAEKGHYLPVLSFAPQDYRGRPQNFDIAEDNRGIIYFANSYGVIEFDGIFWNNINVNEATVYSLDSNQEGIIYVGSQNDFGYLGTDDKGSHVYISLRSHLENAPVDFGEIWSVSCTPWGVYFKADHYLFRWAQGTVAIWQTENLFHTSFYVNNNFYVREENRGLLVMQDDSLHLIAGGEKFSDIAVTGMIPFKEEGLLLFTENDGIYHMVAGAEGEAVRLVRHFNEIDNFLTEHLISCALRINYNQFAVGSHGKGAIIFDQSNDQFDFLNITSGLQDEIIYNMFLDRRGNLWLALSNGIAMSPVSSPVTSFGYSDGIKESIEGICRYSDRLFIATILGTYYLDTGPAGTFGYNSAGQTDRLPSGFRKVEGLEDECFACTRFLYNRDDLLLVATYSGISQIDRDLSASHIVSCYPWYISQSRINPERVIIASENGVGTIYRSGNTWIEETFLDGIGEDCRNLVEDSQGNIWVGTSNSGKAIRIKFGKPGQNVEPIVSVFDSTHHLPKGDIYINSFGNELIFGSSEGLLRYRETDNIFYPDSSFGAEFSDKSRSIHRISVDHEGYLWLVTYRKKEKDYETGYFIPNFDGTFTWYFEPFIRLSRGVIHSIYHDPDGVTWLGGPNGLYRYDRNIKKDYRINYNALVRKVFLNGDSLLFDGTFTDASGSPVLQQSPDEIPVVKYKYNSFAFEYSSPNNEDGSSVLFSHYLEGFDKTWRSWSPEYRREYTNLREGRYTFHLRAKNLYNFESEEAVFSFVIKAPWYRTVLSIIGFILLGTAILWLFFNLYTKRLRLIIQERTKEIREQKEMIEEKNSSILDSINYASRIQTAMLTPGDYIDGLFPERFIFYLPRDIVSGDFYWMFDREGKIICVTADCTGHGVPGAMMSMMGMSYLNEITSKEQELHSDDILNQLRSKIVESLRQKGDLGETQDGMDMALYIIDTKDNTLEFSGAHLPLYLFRKGDLQVIEPDKMPIGISLNLTSPFTRHALKLQKGDILYTFSDGFQDQFGGPKNKKFLIKQFREVLAEIHDRPMRQQKNILKKKLDDWMFESGCEQVDDITVIGVKI